MVAFARVCLSMFEGSAVVQPVLLLVSTAMTI